MKRDPRRSPGENSQKFRFRFPEKQATSEGWGDTIPQVHTLRVCSGFCMNDLHS